ncbi:MAG: hypothetical protein Q7T85_03150 [Nitrosomonas sp.]|nr:hypothetical protein [Nitrosomonas sp.]
MDLREAISQNWSSRALERQIGVLYYERLLSSKDKALVEAEAAQPTSPASPWCLLAKSPRAFIHSN